jgi:hypothetical protein
MSLLLGTPELIEIKMYYKHVDTKHGKHLVILEDSKALELLSDEEKAKGIDVLDTKWRVLTWKEQNDVNQAAHSSAPDPITGERAFDYIKYRDSIIKNCLKAWNITNEGRDVPVTPGAIDSLPSPVVLDLFEKFNKCLDFSEDELGK